MLLFDDFEDFLPLALPVEGWIEEVDVFAYLSQRNSPAKSGFPISEAIYCRVNTDQMCQVKPLVPFLNVII